MRPGRVRAGRADTVMAAARVPSDSAASSAGVRQAGAHRPWSAAPPRCSAARTPALNVSPAPTVSATSTFVAATKRSCVAVTARAPLAPSVMKTTFGPRARMPRASAVRSPCAFQPVQILVRQLHDVRRRDHPLDPRAVRGARPAMKPGRMLGSIIVTRRRRLAGLQRLVGAGGRVVHQADAAEEQRADAVAAGRAGRLPTASARRYSRRRRHRSPGRSPA